LSSQTSSTSSRKENGADVLGRELIGAVNGFAAAALLVMLVTSMAPEAREKVGRPAGVATVSASPWRSPCRHRPDAVVGRRGRACRAAGRSFGIVLSAWLKQPLHRC
jgi:hypothetical protein